MLNKKADFGTPLWAPVAVVFLVLMFILFGIYFFVLTDDKDLLLDANQIPDQQTALILLKAPLDPLSSPDNQPAIADLIIQTYEENSATKDNYELDSLGIHQGDKTCSEIKICATLKEAVSKYISNITKASWVLLVYKMPENKPIVHLSLFSKDILESSYGFSSLTKDDLFDFKQKSEKLNHYSSALLPLEGGKESLEIHLWYAYEH